MGRLLSILPGLFVLALANALGSDVGSLTTFTPGTNISSSAVNSNFSALRTAVNSKQDEITGSCAIGSSIRVINSDGTVTCELDDSGTVGEGDITAVNPGTGLSGGGVSGNVTLSVDTNAIQARVTGSCTTDSAIQSIASDGTVTCQSTGNGGSGDITAVLAGQGLTGGGITGDVTLSVADDSIDSFHIIDEPGLDANQTNALGTNLSTNEALEKLVTITAPSAGFIIARFSAEGQVGHENGTVSTYIASQLQLQSGTTCSSTPIGTTDSLGATGVPGSAATGTYLFSHTGDWVYPVASSGNWTVCWYAHVYKDASNGQNSRLNHKRFWALYIPTQY